jgi:hypothetical protein
MAQFRKQCDVLQGYNFKKDVQSTVGFVTKLSVGGVALAVDTTVKSPLKPTDDLKIVAVASDVLWEFGVTDAVYITGQVSVYNRQSIMGLIINDMTNIEVVFQFVVFEYDPVAKAYFKCFHVNDTDMKGILEKKGKDLNLTITEEPSADVQSPENYTFNVGVKPQPSAQSMTVASSSKKNVVKSWGITVTG